MDEFEVALRALLADSQRWDAIAETLATISKDLGGALVIEENAFSFAGGDAYAAYDAARIFVEGFTRDGSQEATGGSDALVKVHDDYRASDERAEAEYRGKWDLLR